MRASESLQQPRKHDIGANEDTGHPPGTGRADGVNCHSLGSVLKGPTFYPGPGILPQRVFAKFASRNPTF